MRVTRTEQSVMIADSRALNGGVVAVRADLFQNGTTAIIGVDSANGMVSLQWKGAEPSDQVTSLLQYSDRKSAERAGRKLGRHLGPGLQTNSRRSPPYIAFVIFLSGAAFATLWQWMGPRNGESRPAQDATVAAGPYGLPAPLLRQLLAEAAPQMSTPSAEPLVAPPPAASPSGVSTGVPKDLD